MITQLWTWVLLLFGQFGRDAVKRAVTPSRKWVEEVCAKTGADLTQALAARRRYAEATVRFIEELAIPDIAPLEAGMREAMDEDDEDEPPPDLPPPGEGDSGKHSGHAKQPERDSKKPKKK